MSSQQSKRAKRLNSKAPRVALPTRTPAELIDAIPPPPDYVPLPHRQIRRLPSVQLPPNVKKDPYSLFTLFLTESHFKTIATNTNRYAELKNAGSDGKRTWRPTSAEEIKVFIATFIYMGVVRLPAYEGYWDSKYGEFICAQHISLNRFEDLKRYMHISDPTPSNAPPNKDDSDDEIPEKSTEWWHKLEPIASEFRDLCSKHWIPGINLSIDEMMIRCFGRSKHTFKAPNKPIKEGYKMFALCEAGYTYYFMWSSKSNSYGELNKLPDLSPTESMVYQLAQKLPKDVPHVIYMDNLFTRVPILRKLRTLNIGACGTTRRHPEFPAFLLELKDLCSKRLEWNTTAAIVARKKIRIKKEKEKENYEGKDDESQWESDPSDPGVICYAWQDNNTVIACSTVHQAGEEHTIVRSRRRPQATSTNGPLVRKVFGEDVRKDLEIPLFIDDYNHFMGGVDIADQLRAYYSTQRTSLRSWYPLFFWIVDTAILNAYLMGRQLHGNEYMEHKEFRVSLWSSLFSYSTQVILGRKLPKFYSPESSQYTLKPQSSINIQSKQEGGLEHKWKALEKRVYCYNCRQVSLVTKKRKFGDEIPVNVVQRKRAGQTQWACSICDVPLCTSGDCWVDYHHKKQSSCMLN
jgi:hypothetical protein